jgi:ubiquinone/menaquinone biosynthesis C-methylase UbiE
MARLMTRVGGPGGAGGGRDLPAAPDYALRVPNHVRYALGLGLAGGATGLALSVGAGDGQRLTGGILTATGAAAAVVTLLLNQVTSTRARLGARRRMLDAVPWRGDERVLDVGCGNGFLLVEAAKRLTTGKATGIDIWLTDAGQQSGEAVWRNARLEGVADRIEVRDADARAVPFADGTFDVVLASLMLHHAGGAADRERVLREMARVVKPTGTVLLYDMLPLIAGAARRLRASGLDEVERSGGFMAVLAARRPAPSAAD